MVKEYEYLDDYSVGEKLISPARTITETDIVNFEGLTGDWHPLHMDTTYAAKTPFGGRIAHVMLTLSIGMALPFRLGPYSSVLPKSFIALYSMDKIRFMAPTRIGDTIHCEVEVIEITDKGNDKGILTTRYLIKNQKRKVIMSFII
jgi:acyl dehydratase